jgi:hypothetical protein
MIQRIDWESMASTKLRHILSLLVLIGKKFVRRKLLIFQN